MYMITAVQRMRLEGFEFEQLGFKFEGQIIMCLFVGV